MLLMLLSLSAFAGEPEVKADLTIVVEDRLHEEIYVEPPNMFCEDECPSQNWVKNAVFIEAARKHKSWLKFGEVGAVYNSDTIQIAYEDCDFRRESLKCGQQKGVWVLRTTVVVTNEKAGIQLMLFDENGVLIGQGTDEVTKKTTIIERRKVTQQQLPGQGGAAQVCKEGSQGMTTCAAVPINQRGQSVYQTEDLEPHVVVQRPVLKEKHVSQAMIGVYDSVRREK